MDIAVMDGIKKVEVMETYELKKKRGGSVEKEKGVSGGMEEEREMRLPTLLKRKFGESIHVPKKSTDHRRSPPILRPLYLLLRHTSIGGEPRSDHLRRLASAQPDRDVATIFRSGDGADDSGWPGILNFEQFNNPDNYYDRDGQLISANGGAVRSSSFTANTVNMCGATTLVALVNGLQLLARADE
ncbi:hypothetical protein niasHT_027494 [Heterodera trifolii]|uniref:Uncharacterized protein n=1 Tax=Heterodera trifolii TaxID=157864 RepID=A0ABD2JML5_9BILA